MIKNTISLLAVFLFLSSCNDANKSKDNYQQTTELLEKTERKDPVKFLRIMAGDRKNLLGQTVVKGTIQSQAKVHVYKNVEIELSFYSKTKILLEQDKETIYEEIHPGTVKKFKTKYFAPKDTDSIALNIIKAD